MGIHILISSLAATQEPGLLAEPVHLHGHRRFYDLLMEQQPKITKERYAFSFPVDARMVEHVAAGLELPAKPDKRSNFIPFLMDLEVLRLAGDTQHDRATLQPLYQKVIQDLRHAMEAQVELTCVVSITSLPD